MSNYYSNTHSSQAPSLYVLNATQTHMHTRKRLRKYTRVEMALLVTTLASGLAIRGGAPLLATRSLRSSRVCMALHDLTATGMDGTEVPLKSLAGKNVLALNVASR